MRALCRELEVPLLVLDSAALAPYVRLESFICFFTIWNMILFRDLPFQFTAIFSLVDLIFSILRIR